jgi:uncharacterized protein (DUF2147 family)
VLFAFFLATSAPAPSPGIAGDWLTADRSAIVRVGPCGERLCGTVVRVLARGNGVPSTDVNNPDRALRSHPLVGLKVLTGFARDGSGWTGGRAYDPKTGGSYRAKLSLGGDNSLTVTGCILFICKSQRWIRVDRR